MEFNLSSWKVFFNLHLETRPLSRQVHLIQTDLTAVWIIKPGTPNPSQFPQNVNNINQWLTLTHSFLLIGLLTYKPV